MTLKRRSDRYLMLLQLGSRQPQLSLRPQGFRAMQYACLAGYAPSSTPGSIIDRLIPLLFSSGLTLNSQVLLAVLLLHLHWAQGHETAQACTLVVHERMCHSGQLFHI
jgi:hypothetical protein